MSGNPLRLVSVVLALVALAAGGWLLARVLAPGPAKPDFEAIAQPEARKEAFFRWLAPVVEQENERLRRVRSRLERLDREHRSGRALSTADRAFLAELAERYKAAPPGENPGPTLKALLRRVDTVPVRLALVQAAVESGWGTGRFAREANNYYGIWTWRHEGLVPDDRDDGSDHVVAAYPDAAASVRAYLYTLDAGPAYSELRRIRAEARAAGRRPRAVELARGLHGYSQRGQEYVADIRQLLESNAELLDSVLEGP